MRAAIFALAALLLAVSAGAADYEVPWRDVRANVEAHRVIGAIDETSFADAVAMYPGTQDNTGHYAVGVGRLLMWKIVHLFASDQTVKVIRLASFEERCNARTDKFGSSVECTLAAVVEVEEGGETHLIDFETTEPVGAWMRPTEPYRPAVAAEIRIPVDEFVAHIGSELRAAGILQ